MLKYQTPKSMKKDDKHKKLSKPPKSKRVWNGIERNKRPKQISNKKRAQISADLLVKMEIYKRAGGYPYISAGKKGIPTSISCEGGYCEACGLVGAIPPVYHLEIHELNFRSNGGTVNFSNSFAVCHLCHILFQNHELINQAKCIKLIAKFRNMTFGEAELIWNKIMQFYELHKDIIETKVVSKLAH